MNRVLHCGCLTPHTLHHACHCCLLRDTMCRVMPCPWWCAVFVPVGGCATAINGEGAGACSIVGEARLAHGQGPPAAVPWCVVCVHVCLCLCVCGRGHGTCPRYWHEACSQASLLTPPPPVPPSTPPHVHAALASRQAFADSMSANAPMSDDSGSDPSTVAASPASTSPGSALPDRGTGTHFVLTTHHESWDRCVWPCAPPPPLRVPRL